MKGVNKAKQERVEETWKEKQRESKDQETLNENLKEKKMKGRRKIKKGKIVRMSKRQG